MAGLEPGEFSGHGLRSGYLTEATNRGVPLPEAMEQSQARKIKKSDIYVTFDDPQIDGIGIGLAETHENDTCEGGEMRAWEPGNPRS
jgi:hypothetical protein